MRNLTLAFAFLFACGSPTPDGGTPDAKPGTSDVGTTLEGTWVAVSQDNTAGVAYTFTGGAFKVQTIAQLTSGDTGTQLDTGTFTVTGNTATLTLQTSSCVGAKVIANKAKAFTFTKNGTSLQLAIGTTMLYLQQKTAAPTATGVITIGCFRDDDTFIANPVGAVL